MVTKIGKGTPLVRKSLSRYTIAHLFEFCQERILNWVYFNLRARLTFREGVSEMKLNSAALLTPSRKVVALKLKYTLLSFVLLEVSSGIVNAPLSIRLILGSLIDYEPSTGASSFDTMTFKFQKVVKQNRQTSTGASPGMLSVTVFVI
jgi:hypothetical protein